MQALWAEGKRTAQRPALRRENLPGADLLLKHRLAVERGGLVEIQCVSEWWDAIGKDRVQTRARKAKAKQRERGKNAGRTRDSRVPDAPLEKTQVSREHESGEQFALLRSEEDRKEQIPEGKRSAEEKGRFTKPSPPGFDRYWAVVPHKKGKRKALVAWEKYSCERMADAIVAKVEQLKREDHHWRRGFVPHPTTWLNGGGWDDEPIFDPDAVAHTLERKTDVCPRCHKAFFEDKGHRCQAELRP
jgi:hypothetical protein